MPAEIIEKARVILEKILSASWQSILNWFRHLTAVDVVVNFEKFREIKMHWIKFCKILFLQTRLPKLWYLFLGNSNTNYLDVLKIRNSLAFGFSVTSKFHFFFSSACLYVFQFSKHCFKIRRRSPDLERVLDDSRACLSQQPQATTTDIVEPGRVTLSGSIKIKTKNEILLS